MTSKKILIITDAAWRDDNNIGATFNNLFEDYPKHNLASIYARPDLPNTKYCDNFFQISEQRLIKRIFSKEIKTGIKLVNEEDVDEANIRVESNKGKRIYNVFLKFRLNIFLLIREIIWSLGYWCTAELDEFIDAFEPDVILSLGDNSVYLNKLEQYIINKSKSKNLIYFVDDVYSLKQFSISPFYWLHRLLIRSEIKKTVSLQDEILVISDLMRKEYSKYFKTETTLISKGIRPSEINHTAKQIDTKNKNTISIFYAGNIYAGRWDTILSFGRELDNNSNRKYTLDIYTKNSMTKKMIRQAKEIRSISFKGSLKPYEVEPTMKKYDALIHFESFNLKERLITRLSFSTKIVDYLNSESPFIVVGHRNSATIEYLSENDCALIISDLDTTNKVIDKIESRGFIENQKTNSRDLLLKNHNKSINDEKLLKMFI